MISSSDWLIRCTGLVYLYIYPAGLEWGILPSTVFCFLHLHWSTSSQNNSLKRISPHCRGAHFHFGNVLWNLLNLLLWHLVWKGPPGPVFGGLWIVIASTGYTVPSAETSRPALFLLVCAMPEGSNHVLSTRASCKQSPLPM